MTESPGKTQVTQKLVVRPEISEIDLRSLLNARYVEAISRTGFQYHDHPTVVGIYAYPSAEHAASGSAQWVGMLQKVPSRSLPSIVIASYVGSSPPASQRFGLSVAEREDVFRRVVMAEDLARSEAERLHPNDAEAQDRAASARATEYRNKIAADVSITSEQLRDISSEALQYGWAFPPRQ